MAKIKIISNPYKKEIKYQRWIETCSEWEDIDFLTNKTSRLLSWELTEGFFPFKAKQILDIIVDDYEASGETLEILFEGSADEYIELKDAYEEEEYNSSISIQRSMIELENARDILPKVRELFQQMSPLIIQNVSQEKIQRDLGRFNDAASDVVPICVFGNYSAGKSTFINALVGSEILPSGTEPITAKIYKISKSRFSDRACIRCKYMERGMEILFTDNQTHIQSDVNGNALAAAISKVFSDINDESMAVRIKKALSVINDYENMVTEGIVSDLIEVEIPFVNGVLANSQHPFVIFDTPGSNSASNTKHLQVLKQAMANMTNGLPIFLSTMDSLDSTDNENLYHIIRDMDELDSRFTMIVVNKADNAGIQRRGSSSQEQERILNQAVPRNLYSGGLFYVSSIIGLGAKTNGEFMDDAYDDIYDAQEIRYRDPTNRHYRMLYLYNIMPDQIKRRAEILAGEQNNLVYSNSGLFTIETEIETFAGKYAAYNKCFQSQLFLNKVIQITEAEIEYKKDSCEGVRKRIKDELESNKKKLTDRLEVTAEEQRSSYDLGYPQYMEKFLASGEGTFSIHDLKEKEKEFTEVLQAEMDYDRCEKDAKKSLGLIAGNFKINLEGVTKKFNISSVKAIAEGIQSDLGTTVDTYKAKSNARHQVDKAVSSKLLQYVKERYESRLLEIRDLLDRKSQDYWTRNTEELKKVLARIVSGSDVLTRNRRKELEQIIITYQKIAFDDSPAERIFNKDNFEMKIRIFNQVLWQSDHLNIDKLVKTYNTSMTDNVKQCYQSISESHKESAHNWIQNLLDEIYNNIVEYSPELFQQAKLIEFMTKEINALTETRARLKEYSDELCFMMEWKTI